MSEPRRLVETLTLPYKTAQTIYEGSSEVRHYVNDVTGVDEIGKRVSKIGLEDALGFKEAALLQNIKHEHLVPVYTVASVSIPGIDPLFSVIEMIMPFYPRGSVFDVLVTKKETFTTGEAVRLTRHFLAGLDFLHEKHRLIHRDMKSPNVFIDLAGAGRLGDLGVAVPMDPDGTAEAFQAGVQMYTAPEAFPTKRSDRRTDIYGVGLILHEMLNGPFPYEAYERVDIERRLEKGQRAMKDDVLAFKPHVSAHLRTVIRKAIARNPQERYGSAREMMAALAKAAFIDWRRVDDFTWEGALPSTRSISYQVTAARLKRRNGWRLSGKKRLTGWRRCVPDQDVADLSDNSTRDFFDQMVTEATNL
jgi:serine/threonine protein kinase